MNLVGTITKQVYSNYTIALRLSDSCLGPYTHTFNPATSSKDSGAPAVVLSAISGGGDNVEVPSAERHPFEHNCQELIHTGEQN